MLSDNELWEKCQTNEPITSNDLGTPDWMPNTDNTIIEVGGYTIYHCADGKYRFASGKVLTPEEIEKYIQLN